MRRFLRTVARRSLASQPLADAYHGRANGFGALRLAFALAVVLSHSAALGFGRPLLHRVDLGALAVAGFFTISGFLVVGSARRSSVPRFLWHRALRIWPGLWACLLVTGLVVAPVLHLERHGTLDGLWRGPGGVLDYLRQNWWGGLRQFGIADLLVGDTPYWRWQGGNTLNGSLWTLAYEIYCYLAVAVLAALTVLRRQLRWLVLLAAIAVFGVLCWNYLRQGIWTVGAVGPLPLLGALEKTYLLWYGFLFLVGGVAELYRDRLPINDLLGLLALVAVGWLAVRGSFVGPGPAAVDRAFFAPALLAYGYAVLWLAVRLPAPLHRVGRTHDYSYGVYIYSFLVQQVLAKAGVQAVGPVGFLVASAVLSIGLAMLSWHLVEKPALRLKDWTPAALREPPGGPSGGTDLAGAAPDTVPAGRLRAPDADADPAAAPAAG
ncbi:acyltransferase family protein [Micromonospora humi]|uniref:Peptidoglycan/LPS O-acetylase OafA/YrhL, contains acyltransferase and SGNH-hydrolase domains n=1 Tax=Micromonospora humi TaxID=745366 RepID=A0A1C5IUM3_9ACTN|nr:acyltransferase [Micromonospora humi]SCG61701.1 Peptidoglycan/LPS O-acetylase OafA/YrhL, contains acyltransferase and SGNH-hydrolase domains [Micromonospora humi]